MLNIVRTKKKKSPKKIFKKKVALYAPAEREDTVPLFLLYPYMYSVGQPLLPEVPNMYLGASTRMALQPDVLKA